MRKFSGLCFASFVVGVCIPICIVVFMLDKLFSSVPEETVQTTAKELACSYVDLFCVNYNMYGKYTIGSDMLVVDITNDLTNDFDCEVWLEDVDGNRLTSVEKLSPSDKRLTMDITTTWEVPGKYPCKLMYNVNVINDTSVIECPYVILVNGGS